LRERLAELIHDLDGVELVGEAGTAQTALSLVQRLNPDVVILDIRLPGGDGVNVLKAIRQQAAPPRVIMLTAFPYPQYRKRCLEAGADFFFDKATEFNCIAEVLSQLVGSSSPADSSIALATRRHPADQVDTRHAGNSSHSQDTDWGR
jgi:DNA-binding NarL/FixJ family response regulator